MQFTWDAKKAETNARKHGVTFEEASTVFDDDHARYRAQGHAHEGRIAVIGYSAESRCLFVVVVEVEDDAVRIISAREATRHEKKLYQEDAYR